MFWKLCDVIEPPNRNSDRQLDYESEDSKYESIFTYNTERNYVNEYPSTSTENEFIVEIKKQDRGTSDKAIEILFVFLSSIILAITFPFSMIFSLKFISSYERLFVMRLGRVRGVKGPGAVVLLPFVDTSLRLDMRITRLVVPSIQFITMDKGIVELSILVFTKIFDPSAVCCCVQDKDQTLNSLAYTLFYKKFAKRPLADIVDPVTVNKILQKCQEELNKFSASFGVTITKVDISQLKIIKQGENPAVSLFSTFMKSNAGQELIGHLGKGLQTFVSDSTNSTTKSNEGLCNNFECDVARTNKDAENSVPNNLNIQDLMQKSKSDAEIKILIQRINSCCSISLVSKVNVYYRIKSLGSNHEFDEFDIDLRTGAGWCGFSTSNEVAPDVFISLKRDTLFALINGSLTPLSAYINGLISVSGSITDAVKLKYLAEKASEIT